MEELPNIENSGLASLDSNQDPQFQWSAKQEHVAQMLKKIDGMLPDLYYGGWDAFRHGRHDFLAQSAHSFRELMEKIAFLQKGNKLPGTNDALTGMVFPKWDDYKKVNPSHLDKAEVRLAAFLNAFTHFRSWFATYHTTRRKRSGIALEMLRRGLRIPEEFDSDIKDWHKMERAFTDISHHRGSKDVTKESFLNLITQFEALLLKYVRGLESHKLLGIQKIVTEVGPVPSHEDLSNILSLLRTA